MTHVMQAPGYGEPETLDLVEIDLPPLESGQVRVAIRAAGVNPADLKQLRGQFGRKEGITEVRLGSEAAGVVTEIAADAVGPAGPIAVGDEVIAYRITGGYAEEVIAKASSIIPKPASLSWEDAASLLSVAVTAEHMLASTAVGEGDAVIIHGASGGVGLSALQLAKLRGARVIGTASERNRELLESHGAEFVTYGDCLLERLQALLPESADAALDTVGTDEALDTSIALVADRNRIATIANANFERGAELGIHRLGGGAGADPGTDLRNAARLPITKLAGEGKFDVVVGRSFPLAEAAAALCLIETGHAGGKIVLLP